MRAARRSCWAAILAHGRAWLVAPRPDLATLDRLLGLMQQRLALMHDVARWQWKAGQPITDPKRERELLQSVVERGRGKGVEPKLVRPLPKNRRCARRCGRCVRSRLAEARFLCRWGGPEQFRSLVCTLRFVSLRPTSRLPPPSANRPTFSRMFL